MGGGIAGVYAAKYGDEMLSSVVVVCPAGINSPEMSEFLKKSRDDMRKNKDENMLLPRNAGEFKEMMKMVMYHDIQIPSHIADVFVQLKLLKLQVYKKGIYITYIPVHVCMSNQNCIGKKSVFNFLLVSLEGVRSHNFS